MRLYVNGLVEQGYELVKAISESRAVYFRISDSARTKIPVRRRSRKIIEEVDRVPNTYIEPTFQWIDEEGLIGDAGMSYDVRYVETGQPQIKQGQRIMDQCLPTMIEIAGGQISVQANNRALIWFLKNHPKNGTVFYEHDANKEVSKRNADRKLELELSKLVYDELSESDARSMLLINGMAKAIVDDMTYDQVADSLFSRGKEMGINNFKHWASRLTEIEKERFEQAVNSGMVTAKTSSKDGCVRWHNSTSASNLMICKVPEGEDDLEYLMKYLSESNKDDHKSLVLDIRNRYA
tara:strand:+ start:2431 stop:3312 length:882 start_codon:yes stop_codon:yes gene_type:complete